MNELRLFVFLVGQPQLIAQKSAFQAQGKEQIVSRFMIEELHFRGITSPEACATCLSAYDQGEYPAGSGWCYTRFFLPRAYAAGLRLQHEAAALWQAFEDAHFRANLSGNLDIPMKYFTTAVEAAFLTSMEHDASTLKFSDEFWAQMVGRSRYVLAHRAGRVQMSSIAAVNAPPRIHPFGRCLILAAAQHRIDLPCPVILRSITLEFCGRIGLDVSRKILVV